MTNKSFAKLFGRTVIVSIFLVGCKLPRTTFAPLENGYWLAGHYRGAIHESARAELQYQTVMSNKIIIWPALVDVVIKDETAVFTGLIHGPSGPASLSFLFAFRPPGPVVEITQKVLELKARQRGESFSKVPKSATIVTLKKMDDGIECGIAAEQWGDPKVKVSWKQIATFIQEAKEKGVERKDGLYGTRYTELLP